MILKWLEIQNTPAAPGGHGQGGLPRRTALLCCMAPPQRLLFVDDSLIKARVRFAVEHPAASSAYLVHALNCRIENSSALGRSGAGPR